MAKQKINSVQIYNPYKFTAYRSASTQSIASGYTPIKIQCQSESFDTNSNYNTSTYEYTVPVTGYYYVYGSARIKGLNSVQEIGVRVANTNASTFRTGLPINEYTSLNASGLYRLTSGTKIYLQVYCSGGGTVYASSTETILSAFLVSTS